jgi:hypothetical protein
MTSKRDLSDIANELVPNSGDEAWLTDPDQHEHNHAGQSSGETHADGFHLSNDGSGPSWSKYHSDDE